MTRSTERALFITGRPMLGAAYATVLARSGVQTDVIDHPPSTMTGTEPRFRLVMIDLDAPTADAASLAESMHRLVGLRLGLYDDFTAEHARLAFELGVRRLVSTRDDIDAALVAAAQQAAATVTRAKGVGRESLRRLSTLSDREMDVLREIAAGRPGGAGAARLGIARHTFASHRRRALSKLGVSTQEQAVGVLARAGLTANASQRNADSSPAHASGSKPTP